MSRTPPMNNKTASAFLNKSDQQGAHNRSQHVGQTGQQLKGRNIPTATTYLSKADQNMGAKSFLNSPTGKNLKSDVASGPLGTKFADSAPQKGGRLSPIAKVAVQKSGGGSDVFNAKVTSNRMVMVKNAQGVKAQSTFPDGGTPLEKPRTVGPNLKPNAPLSVPGPQGLLDRRKGVVNLAKNARQFGNAVQNAKANLNQVSAKMPQGGMNAGNPVALANAKKTLKPTVTSTPKLNTTGVDFNKITGRKPTPPPTTVKPTVTPKPSPTANKGSPQKGPPNKGPAPKNNTNQGGNKNASRGGRRK